MGARTQGFSFRFAVFLALFVVSSAHAAFAAAPTAQNRYTSTQSAQVAFAFDAGSGSLALYAFDTTPAVALHRLFQSASGAWNLDRSRFVAGDFDGDGRTDAAACCDYGRGQLGLFLFESSRGFAPRRVHLSATGAWRVSSMSFAAADADGDGRDDVVALVGLSRRRVAAYAFPSAASYAPRRLWLSGENFAEGYEVSAFSGDFDGDGLDDAALAKFFYNGDVQVFWLPRSSGFAARALTGRARLGLARERSVPLGGDADGDGVDDVILCAGRADGSLVAYRGASSAGFSFQRVFASAAGAFPFERTRASVDDVRGEGRASLVVQRNSGTTTRFYELPVEPGAAPRAIGASSYGFGRARPFSSNGGASFATRPRDAIRWFVEPRLSFAAGAIRRAVVYNTRKSGGIYAAFFDASGRKLFTVPCSSGRPGSRSALGTFTVRRKAPVLRSFNGLLYAPYPVYYREHSALHAWPYYTGTTTLYHYELLGKPASSGCIRLPLEASRLVWLGSKPGYTQVTVLP